MRPETPLLPPEALIDAAALVADGADLDWGTMSSRLASDEERELADVLASVARIAREHRRLHDLLPDEPAARALRTDAASWGHLQLLEVLGRGAYGTVYRAWDGRLDRQVALKLFHGTRDPEGVMREGRMLAKVRHDNVVSVYGADVIDGVAGLWMEYLRGRNLDRIVREQGPLSARETTLIGLDVARAMAAVHAAGLLHCDVKAQNVVREPGGRVVLMDLGAGRAAELPAADSAAQGVTGTPLYMAPELFAQQAASPQSDVYSLGVLLFYLASGQYPVRGKSLSEIRAAHAEGRRHHLRDVRPDLPSGFLREVTRALDPDPAKRHQSAGELEAALHEVLSPEPVRPQPVVASKRWSLAVAAFAALIAALAVGPRLVAPPPAIAPQGVRTVAVLPIRNLTGDAGKAYVADGLTQILIANLARIKTLRVPSFSAVARYRETSASSREIASSLGVELLLAGSMTEAGDVLRLDVTLIDPQSDTIVWSQPVVRQAADKFSAQSDVARLLAAELSLKLSPEEQRALSQRAPAPAAQESYLRGLAAAQSFLSSTAPVAAGHFRRATELDPGFAAAYAELALIELRLIEETVGADRRARAGDARRLAERAIDLDPGLGTGYAALGSVQFAHDWDFAAAEDTFRRGLSVSPTAFTMQRYAALLAALSRLDEAVAMGTQARDLEPLVPSRATSLGILHYYRRDYDRAIAEMQRSLALVPTFPPGHFGMGRIYAAAGRYDDAIAAIERSIAQERIGAYVVELARVHAAAGHRGDVARLRTELEALKAAGEGFSEDNYAYIAAAEGRVDEAFAILDRAVDQRLTNILWLAVDPRVDPLRTDARFDALLRRIGLR
jgi:serine/threonine-protein kinase